MKRTICSIILPLLLSTISLMGAGCAGQSAQTAEERLQNADEQVIQLLAQVRKMAGEGRYGPALQLADSLLGLAPELPESHYEKGLILNELHQLEAAEMELQEASRLDPYHRGAWYQQGHVAFQQRDYARAIKLYTRQTEAINTSPKKLKDFYSRIDARALPQSWLQIGRAYELAQNSDSALWAYQKVLDFDSSNVQVNTWLAALYREKGDTEKAFESINRAWNAGTGNPEVGYELGTLLFESGDLKQALPLFKHVVSIQPWHAGAHYNLGRTLMALGEVDSGQQHLDITDSLQDLEQSIDYARAAVAQFPDQPARWRELISLLERAGRKQEQIQAQQVLQALNSYNNP